MSQTTADLVQVYRIYIEAPVEKVWDAITTSEYTNKWGYGGDVEFDLTPGGAYRNLTTPDMRAMGMGEVAVSGEVLEVEVNKLLKLTWAPAWYPDAEPTILTWELTQFESGLTLVTLTHDSTANPQLAVELAGGGEPTAGGGGWPWSLAGLKTLIETGRPMAGQE